MKPHLVLTSKCKLIKIKFFFSIDELRKHLHSVAGIRTSGKERVLQ